MQPSSAAGGSLRLPRSCRLSAQAQIDSAKNGDSLRIEGHSHPPADKAPTNTAHSPRVTRSILRLDGRIMKFWKACAPFICCALYMLLGEMRRFGTGIAAG
jgi:hypothetical protein